jgi:ABC-2 type transport system permease protein
VTGPTRAGGLAAVRLVARRELSERVRERSFQFSTALSVVIVALVVLLPKVLGFGGPTTYELAPRDAQSAAVARAAQRLAPGFDARVEIVRSADITLRGGTIRAQEAPDDQLVTLLQVANRQLDARARPPLRVVTAKPVDPERDRKSGLAFLATLVLYGQLLTYGVWVATGVVEEKASRVIEVLLAAIRPRDLLAGKVIGLGLLGLGQLLVIAVFGLGIAAATGALDVDGAVVAATALAVAWFVLGYAFYACAFACAGALVPRQEELQSSLTPLTLIILISMFLAFAVNGDPDGTLAHVTAFLPTTAPITMPGRLMQGEVPAWEVVAAAVVTLGATALLVPLAARIYGGAVLRTGSAMKLRDAWRAARA